MLNLDSISFSADTSQLDLAAKKIESLGTALSALSVDLNKLDKASSTAAKSQQTIAKAAEDAAKAEEQLSKAKTSTVSSTDAATRAVEKQTLAMKIFRGEAVDLNDQVLTLGSSFTKGQSGQLANLKLLGATNDQLKVLAGSFEDFNKITSANTFDNSAAGLGKLSKEIFELKKVNDLMQRGVALTRDEIVNLVRDSERLTQQFKSEGLSAQQTVQALGGLEAQTIKLAKEKNELIARTRASELAAKSEASVLEKAAIDSAKANDFLAREMSRVDNVLDGFNNNLNITSSNRLLKFREQLKLSGTDAITAEKMLKTYEERLKTINATSTTNSKNKREDELKYLARATSVQLGDIGISLAGGQNPLLVLIQQGDQLRGVLNQVGASGGEMQKALSMAFGQIVTGSKDVVMALGSFVVGAFVDTGKAITDFAVKATGTGNALEIIRYKLTLLRNEGSKTADVLLKAFSYAPTVIGAGIGAMIALSASAAVALIQVTNANDDLSRSLIATGAQFGFTTEYAQGLATVLSGMGATRVDVLNAFGEISKSGNITAESFLQVAEAALAIERVGGPAVKETVALMGQLKEKSVETLTKYAEQTGLITTAQIAYVAELVNTGKEISATAEATDILTAAIKEQASVTYASLSSMGRLWIDLKNHVNSAWGSLQDFVSGSGLLDLMAWSIGNVAAIWLKIGNYIAKDIRLVSEFAAKSIAIGKDALNLDTNFTEFKKISASIKEINNEREISNQDELDRLQQKGKYTTENMKKEAQAAADLRKKRSEEASDFTLRTKEEKKIKEELDKLDKNNLTKQQFIAKAIESQTKALGQRNKMTEKNLADVTKIASAEWDKANKPKKEKAPKLTEGQKGLEEYADIVNKANGLTSSYNNELKKLQAARKDGYITEQQYVQAVEELIQQQPFYIKGLKEIADNEKALEKLIDNKLKLEQELNKVKDENSKFLGKEQLDIDKATNSSKMRLELLGKTADEQFAITEQYRLQNQLAEISLKYDERRAKLKSDFDKLVLMPDANVEKLKAEYAKSLSEVNNQQILAVDSAMQGSANIFEVQYIEKILNVGKVLSDAITTALFEGGQAGTKKLKDYIVGVFREKINVQINAVVNSMLGVGTGNSGTPTGISATLSNISSGVGNILSSIGSATGISAGVGAFSTGMSLGSSAILPGLEMMSSASGISSFMAGAGQAAGGAFAAAGPYVLAAMALKELMAYKIEAKGNGLTATVGGSKGLASGSVGMYNEFEQTGGFLGGGVTTNRDWSTAGKGVSDYVTKSTLAIQAATKEYAKALGLTTDAVDGFTKNIEVSLTGLDAKGQKEAIDKALGGFADEMISSLFGDSISSLAKEGETSSATMQRLVSDIVNVNSALDLLGGSLIPLGMEGAKLASSMADAFGGVEKMNSTVQAYYDTMYTDSEKTARSTEKLSNQFKSLGVEMPKSEASFRNLVNGIDSTTSSGQKLIAALMALAPAFATASAAAESAANDMIGAVQNWGSDSQVRELKAQQIQRALAAGGLDMDISTIMNQTKETALAFYNSLDKESAAAKVLLQNQQMIFDFVGGSSGNKPAEGSAEWWAQGYGGGSGGSDALMPGGGSGSTAANVDKTIQATLDYNQAMLEATGTTEEIAAAQRALADAAKLAAGWTREQIKALNQAVDLKANLATLEQARQSVIGLFKTIEDNAKNTQAAVDSAKQSITQGYLSAVDRQKQAQENVNSLIRQAAEEMRGFSNGIKDFLIEVGGSDLGTNSKLEQLSVLQAQFDAIANLARGGDRKAFGEVTDKARGLLTAGKGQFATAEDFARFSANIGNTLTELSGIAEAQAGPIAEAVDPMVAAQQELALATADVVKWSEAISISGAATSLATTDYLAEWRLAEAANVIAQQELREAQLLTKDVNMQLLTVLQQLVAVMAGFNAANAKTPVYGGDVAKNPIGNVYAGMGSDVKTIQDLYSVNLGREGDIAGMDYWAKEFLADGVIDAAERTRFAIASMPEYQSKLPSFAVGINEVPYDMTAQLHKGERIMPAADNSELMARLSSPNLQQDNNELTSVVQELSQRLMMIESNTASTAVHAAKTARLLDRAMPDGDAVATRTAAAL